DLEFFEHVLDLLLDFRVAGCACKDGNDEDGGGDDEGECQPIDDRQENADAIHLLVGRVAFRAGETTVACPEIEEWNEVAEVPPTAHPEIREPLDAGVDHD